MQSCNRFEREILGNILIDIDFSQYSCLAPRSLDEKRKEDKKQDVHEEENIKEDTRNAEEGEQK
ncbi:hypothetical protein MYX76_15400, partial [Desulfobacterota bacterium AH_259_B03_O07]|nr:hypothetical protein [Desulfobacterota bacterium AH_259_B03_O07]